MLICSFSARCMKPLAVLSLIEECIQMPAKSWVLLMLCGVVEAVIAVIYLVMAFDGHLTFHAWNGAVALAGQLAMAAGACVILAGIWWLRSWLLILNGLALGVLGFIQFALVRRFPISFRTIALLVIVTAITSAALGFMMARSRRRERHATAGWIFELAGAVSICFALMFFAFGVHWIRMGPGSHIDFLWRGAYFAFSAISMLALPFGNPRHAH